MSLAYRSAITLGGVALLGATASDTLAMIGRHVGLPFEGSIEVIQPLVLVAGSIALVIATLRGGHAQVRLLIDRLPAGTRAAADRGSDLATALLFLAMLAGSAWIAVDLWGGHEVSELVGVPWRWMRVFACLCFAVAAAIAASRALGRGPR